MLASNAMPAEKTDPSSAAEMPRMMVQLGIEPSLLKLDHPALYASMESICANCEAKGICRHDLETGLAPFHMTEYCGNASTLTLLETRGDLALGE